MMLPESYRKITVVQRGTDPYECLEVQETGMRQPHAHDLLVRNRYAGVNALDIGRMLGTDENHPEPPFDFGIEAIGEVVAIGNKVEEYKVGDAVVTILPGNGYREYSVIDRNFAAKIPAIDAQYTGIFIDGVLAKIAMDFIADIQGYETVMVTSALSASGHFAVQLAKAQGCHVVGTCAHEGEADLLRTLGIDRIILRESEDVTAVLSTEYKDMLNVVYDTFGGNILDACIMNTAPRARIIVANAIREQIRGESMLHTIDLYHRIIRRSAALIGINLSDYANAVPIEGLKLVDMIEKGDVQPFIDKTVFEGIEAVPDALAHLMSGAAQGKVVVKLG